MDFDLEFLDSRIIVFKRAFKNSLLMKKFYEENFIFEKWMEAGEQIPVINMSVMFDVFPDKVSWNNETLSKCTNEYCQESLSLCRDVTEKYLELVDFKFDQWGMETPVISKYEPSDQKDVHALGFHTDFQKELKDAPGLKYSISTTFYLNDNYNGGEIIFDIKGKDSLIKYKPKSGDIVVFPSEYLHAANSVQGGEKTIIRYNWRYNFPGTEEWLANQKFYGEDQWSVMEEERVRKEIQNLYFHNEEQDCGL